MFVKDLTNHICTPSLLPAAIRTASANGTAVDCLQMDDVIHVILTAGVITDGTHAIKVEESDASGGTYTEITASGGTGFTSLTSSAGGSACQVKQYQRTKRYVRVASTVTGSPSTGGFYSANVLGIKKSVV